MYNSNQSPSSRRAGEDFLRRMSRAESGSESSSLCTSGSMKASCGCKGNADSEPSVPSCDASLSMPALAMVYSPVQPWENLMPSPQQALANGTLFQALWKPFEGSGRSCGQRCSKG